MDDREQHLTQDSGAEAGDQTFPRDQAPCAKVAAKLKGMPQTAELVLYSDLFVIAVVIKTTKHQVELGTFFSRLCCQKVNVVLFA